MKRIAIIPARGGSKRLPRKNLLHLGGKPLFEYTIDAVVNSNCFETILFSSDDDEMLELASRKKGVTTEKRVPRLATDSVKVIDLVKEITDKSEYKKFDQIGLFLPTCPFRSAKHISVGIKYLTPDDLSVVSVCEMNDPLQLSLTLDPKTQIMNPEAILNPSPLVTGDTRSQDFKKYYRVNGGFYISWMKKFREKENFFQGQVKGYIMDKIESIDIDHAHDLDYANMLLEKNYISFDK